MAIGKKGGRYTTKSLNDELDKVVTEPIHSNEENDGIEIAVSYDEWNYDKW